VPYKDPERRKEYNRRYHAENREKHLASNRAWRDENAESYREAKRRSALLRRYGISQEQFVDLFEAQDGACAICGTSEPGGRRNTLHIDHCHDTGKVRGLLCNPCNLMLGLAKDNPAALTRAADYLLESR